MDSLDSWHVTMWRVYSRHCCTPFLSLSRRGGVNWWLNQCRKTLDDGLFVFIILCEPCSDYSLLLRLGEGKLGVSRVGLYLSSCLGLRPINQPRKKDVTWHSLCFALIHAHPYQLCFFNALVIVVASCWHIFYNIADKITPKTTGQVRV